MVALAVVTVWCGGAQMMEMQFGWWWCSFDRALMMPCLMMMCLEMTLPWSHDDLAFITWWRWLALMEMVAWWVSAMLRITWFVDGDDMMMSCLDSLMEMTWWCLAMIDMLMTYLVDDDMIHSCWWDVDELMSLVMRYPIPFHSPTLALALPILAIPCKTLIHPS